MKDKLSSDDLFINFRFAMGSRSFKFIRKLMYVEDLNEKGNENIIIYYIYREEVNVKVVDIDIDVENKSFIVV